MTANWHTLAGSFNYGKGRRALFSPLIIKMGGALFAPLLNNPVACCDLVWGEAFAACGTCSGANATACCWCSHHGMGFRPMPNVESTLIKFSAANPSSYQKYIKNLQDTLDTYAKLKNNTNAVDCDNEQPDLLKKEVCIFEIDTLGSVCTAKNDYGYKDGTPCVLLKVNKVYGWQPVEFDNDTLANKDDRHAQDAKEKLGARLAPEYIGITCEGENEGDADNVFKASYFPEKGFSYQYFPYYNYPNYMPPLVFVQLNVRKGALIQVWCKLWAKNIKHHKNDKAGSTHFELLVD